MRSFIKKAFYIQFMLLFPILICFFNLNKAVASEPQHEYEKPGFHEGHGYDGILPEETIDLFTGALNIAQQDFHINNLSKMEQFETMLTRRYSSKIFRQQISGSGCSATAQSIDDEFAGQGWTIHFGRLWDWDQFGQSYGHPVLELPNGSRIVFSTDYIYGDRMISRSGWTLKNIFNIHFYEACSPGPDGICIVFVNEPINWPTYQDIRGGRNVLHAFHWQYAGTYLSGPGGADKVGPHFEYDRDAAGHVWPIAIRNTCYGSGVTTINWDNTKLQPTMDSITANVVGGQANYNYQYIIQNGHILLDKSTSPEGRTYKYDYDPATNELIQITISTDTVIDNTDAVIKYTYATHTFPINQFFLSSACTRVVTEKKVKKSDGSFDIWAYDYPSSEPHKVTVTDPKGNKREVTFQGYSTIDPYVWNVGLILRDETFEGSASIIRVDSIYDSKMVSPYPDAEAYSYDYLRTPILLASTKTYSQTGQQTTTSYGTTDNYDRYGNPDFKIEKNFDGSVLRTTQYEYSYRNGDEDDSFMEEANYVRDLSKTTVFDSAGQIASEISYERYDTVDVKIGAVENRLTLDSESGTNIRKTFDYHWSREVYKIYEQTEGADWITENSPGLCNGILDFSLDPLTNEAGGLWSAEVDWPTSLYSKIHGQSFEPPTNFSYDLDLRLAQIAPPEGDAINIDYDDTNRKVTVTQGTSSSVENYDNLGRLTKRQVNISSGVVSTQTFEYDSLNNLTKQSEKTLDVAPTTFIDKVYDALNRVRSITTADGTTTYAYNGPDITITVQSESGNLITTQKYDAGGRLIKVVEPNGIATTYAYDVMDRLIRVCHQDNDDVCAAGHSNKRSFVYSTRGKLLTETHPESGITTYKYDLLGHLIEKKFDGMTTPIRYTNDNRGRVLNVDYPNDPDISFYYDGDYSSRPVPGHESQGYTYPKGHLTGMVDSTGTTIWPDWWYRRELLKRDIYFNGNPNVISLQYTYDSRGNLESIQYPSGQIVKTYRNDANAINQITRKFGTGPETNLLSSASYNAALLPSDLSLGNGVNLSITSDVRNRPDVMSSAGKLTLDYRYNIRGLIDQIVTSQNGGPSQPRTFSYDNLGRLTTFNSDVASLNYAYDIFGNFISKSGPINAGPFTYTNNPFRMDQYSYSDSGNQLSINGKTLVYNDENKIKQVLNKTSNVSYFYDGQGNRVKSFDALTGKSRYFIYDEGGTLLSELSSILGPPYIEKEYIQGPTGTIAVAGLDEIPHGLKAYDLDGKIRVQWTPLSNCAIAGYNVYRSTTQNGTYTLQNTGGPITNGIYDDGNITECTTYWYQIKTVYNGGAEGSASTKISRKFLNLRAVLYNSPSPGIAPLNETFTYNKAGGCPSAGSNSYVLDFGDGQTQSFTSPGTANHTYTSSSSCYPFCIAKLTVTFTNGVVATQRRLTSMSTSLFADENFSDGIADGFTAISGTWSVAAQIYTGSSTGTTWGITRSSSTCNNCVIAAQANTAAGANKNAYVVFGFIDASNFQYAGYDIAASKWVIGDVVNGTKTDRTSFTQTLGTGVWHSIEVKLEAASKTVMLKGNGVTRCMYTFSTLYSLPIGFAIKGGQSSFDNFKIGPGYTVTSLHSENFNDGVANGYTPVAGTWSIVSSRYRGTIATTTDAVSLTPVSSFNSGVIAADLRVVTNNGWVIFDYVNSTNFKFAGIDEPADKWVIGDVVNGTKTNRATFTQVLNANTIYPTKVLLEGSTATIVNSNTIKTRYAFASLTPRPVGTGLRGNGTCDFDNVSIYTEAFPGGTVTNPPAVPPPTSSATTPNIAADSYASPSFYYNLNDHLGTARITMNQAGAVTASVEYFPFGELKSITGCAETSQRFTGKLLDNESGLQYFGARYLSNDLTRFTSVDPSASSINPANPQSWNRYVYTLNNPLTFLDPNGRQEIDPGTGRPPQYLPPSSAPPPATLPSPTPTPPASAPSGTGSQLVKGAAPAAGSQALKLGGLPLALILLFPSESGGGDEIVEMSKIDRNAFKKERQEYWKKEANNNPDKYSPEDLERMKQGRPPIGPDGHPTELHHTDRTPEGGVQPMSRTDHRLGENYKKNHPSEKKNANE